MRPLAGARPKKPLMSRLENCSQFLAAKVGGFAGGSVGKRPPLIPL